MADESGWVIVRDSRQGLLYWTGEQPKYPASWSNDNLVAVRFSRWSDADRVKQGLQDFFKFDRVEDHMWCAPLLKEKNS